MNSKIETGTVTETVTETAKLPDEALEDVAGAGILEDAGGFLKAVGQEAAHYGAVGLGWAGNMAVTSDKLHEILPNYIDGKTGRK